MVPPPIGGVEEMSELEDEIEVANYLFTLPVTNNQVSCDTCLFHCQRSGVLQRSHHLQSRPLSPAVKFVRLPHPPRLQSWVPPDAPQGFRGRPRSPSWEAYLDTVDHALIAMYTQEMDTTYNAELARLREGNLDIADYYSVVYLESIVETVEDEVAKLRAANRVLLSRLQQLVQDHFQQLTPAPPPFTGDRC